MYNLIKGKLDHCNLGRRRRVSSGENQGRQHLDVKKPVEVDNDDLDEIDALKNVQYKGAQTGNEIEEHRLKQVRPKPNCNFLIGFHANIHLLGAPNDCMFYDCFFL